MDRIQGGFMTWRNSRTHWGWLVIVNHWLSVILISVIIALGLWMVDLTYYHGWYHKAPELHKSLGLLLFALTLFRLFWRLIDPRPIASGNHTNLEQHIARYVHVLFYILLLAIMISGYLISTADGRSIEVFRWFEVPALFAGIEKQEDIAGEIHYWLSMALIILVFLHSAAAVKHHIVDKDNTLKGILWK